MTVDELNVVITAQNREFNQALGNVIGRLDDLEEQSRRTGDSIQGIFSKAAHAIAGLGIGKIISDSIANAGELEQNLGGVEVVFRQHADVLKATAVSAAENMGLSQSAYLATANKMGALFKGSGFDTASAADMSQKAMQRAADVASIMGVDVASAMEAVTGAAKGNFTMMDNLGVAMNDTTLQAYAQAKGLGKLETTQQKVAVAMQMFLDKTEYAAGNYAKENDTFSGSLTTLKAEFENLTADLGTTLLPTATALISVARSGLELIAPLVTGLGEGINAVAQHLLNLSPGAKTMLGIMVGSALVIPAVTKAQLLYNAANKAWKGLLSILIPKQATFNSVLKATFGWLGVIAGLLSIVAGIGATAREMNSGGKDALDDTAAGADEASESVDDLSQSYEGLGSSAEAAKKQLADIDTLNVFGSTTGSTGGIDFAAITAGAEEASAAVADVNAQIGDLGDEADGFNLDSFSDTFATSFSDIGTGFATIFDAFNFDSDTQLSSLRTLDEQVRGIFGDDWSDFWTDVGSTMYQAFNGHGEEKRLALEKIEGWLTDINNFLTGWMGDFGKIWTDFWVGIGAGIHQAWVATTEWFAGANEYGTNMYTEVQKYMSQGYDFSEAIKLVSENMGLDMDAQSASAMLGITGGVSLYTHGIEAVLLAAAGEDPTVAFADYAIPQQTGVPLYNGGASIGPQQAELPADANTGNTYEIRITNELDGNVIGESVTTWQEREGMRANGY